VFVLIYKIVKRTVYHTCNFSSVDGSILFIIDIVRHVS